MPDDVFTLDDLRELLAAAAHDLEHESVAAARKAQRADSGASRHQWFGEARAYDRSAAILRMVAAHGEC